MNRKVHTDDTFTPSQASRTVTGVTAVKRPSDRGERLQHYGVMVFFISPPSCTHTYLEAFEVPIASQQACSASNLSSLPPWFIFAGTQQADSTSAAEYPVMPVHPGT